MTDPMRKPEGTITKEEFFEWARKQDQPYELIDGRPRPKWLADDGVTMMAGENSVHVTIQASLIRFLNNKLEDKGKPCLAGVYGVNVTFAAGLNSQGKDHIVYPDVTVDCGYESRTEDETYYGVSPQVVFEILSPSTRKFDLDEKLGWYKDTPGIENIVYVEQHRIHVRLFVRQTDGWLEHIPLRSLTDALHLPALDISLTLAEVYRAVFKT